MFSEEVKICGEVWCIEKCVNEFRGSHSDGKYPLNCWEMTRGVCEFLYFDSLIMSLDVKMVANSQWDLYAGVELFE